MERFFTANKELRTYLMISTKQWLGVKFFTRLSLAKTNIMNQEKIYLRFDQAEGKVDINFVYKIKENVWRQFNLSRKSNETLAAVSNRIGINVHKALNKTNKKKDVPNIDHSDVLFYDENDTVMDKLMTCDELFHQKNPIKLKIFDTVLGAILNPPWVVSINLPKTILAGFPIYPENFKTQFTEDECIKFKWYVGLPQNEKGNQINDNHIEWTLAGNDFIFTPSAIDIGKKTKLECIPGNKNFTGPPVEHISTNIIEAGPGECPFELRQRFTNNKLEGKSFRCVTYNILADLYCDSDFSRTVLHPYCPAYALHIDYRKQLIIKELLGYNADLICLQEVDKKNFLNCLEPLLGLDGFDGKFYRKGKEVAEGLSIFYRRNRFRFLSDEKITLSNAIKTEKCFADIWEAIQSNQPLLDRLLDRSTVASATVLQSADDPNQILIVGNTHLYFHPDADHIRLIQGGMFVYWLQYLRQIIIEKMNNKHVSVVMCGDFNSVPSCGIYQLYTTGSVPNDLKDWESNEKEAVKNLTLSQNLRLASACGTPQYTNFTAGFADCLDYIFYDSATLKVEQVVPFPSMEELTANTAIPSVVFPSDHIACISDLSFCKPAQMH